MERAVSDMDDDELSAFRTATSVSSSELSPAAAPLTTLENVLLAPITTSMDSNRRTTNAPGACDWVGLGDRLQHKPNELSGGQRQRWPSPGRYQMSRPACAGRRAHR